jgi:hypothetical protein
VLFAGLHLPLAFADVHGPSQIAWNVGALLAAAVGLRLLIATLDVRTSGSLLAAGLAHASFNASAGLVAPDHDWLRYTAVLVLGFGLTAALLGRGPAGRRAGQPAGVQVRS